MNPVSFSVVSLFLAVSAQAADFPMSGQDVVYHSAPQATELSLNTPSSSSFQLADGHPYRLRFSNASSDFTIMPGDGTATAFHVNGGFPNGDLRNFTGLSGANFGNPGVMMSASTKDQEISRTSPAPMTQACSFACGTHEVCHTTPIHVFCTGVGRDRDCEIIGGEDICSDQTTYCAGSQDTVASTVTSGTVYRVEFTDTAGALLGSFDGAWNVTSRVDTVQVLTACH